MSSFWISTLADAAVRATALLGIAAAIAAIAGRRSAALRHFVWALALAGVLLLPLAGAVLPEVPVPMPMRWTAAGGQPAAAAGAGPAGAEPRHDARAPLVAGRAAGPAAGATRDSGPATAPPAVARPGSAGIGAAESASPDPATPPAASWSSVLLGIWGVGAVAFAAWSLASIWNIRRLVAQATPVTARNWLDPLRDVCARLDIRRPVRLLQSDRVAMPMTWGWRQPVILLPATASEWQSPRRTVVLRHELAHVKRADVVTQSLAQWACAAYWFNPVVWFAAFRLRVGWGPGLPTTRTTCSTSPASVTCPACAHRRQSPWRGPRSSNAGCAPFSTRPFGAQPNAPRRSSPPFSSPGPCWRCPP